MTHPDLGVVLQNAEGSGRVEFKRSCLWPLAEGSTSSHAGDEQLKLDKKFKVQGILMRLANANPIAGGYIELGRENDGRRVGLVNKDLDPVTPAQLSQAEQRLSQIAGQMRPSMSVRWHLRLHEGVTTVVIEVPGRPQGGWYQDSNGVTKTGSGSHPVIADPALLQRWAREGESLIILDQRRRDHQARLNQELVQPVIQRLVEIAWALRKGGVYSISHYPYCGDFAPLVSNEHPLADDLPNHYPALVESLRAFEADLRVFQDKTVVLRNAIHEIVVGPIGTDRGFYLGIISETHTWLLGAPRHDFPFEVQERDDGVFLDQKDAQGRLSHYPFQALMAQDLNRMVDELRCLADDEGISDMTRGLIALCEHADRITLEARQLLKQPTLGGDCLFITAHPRL